MSTSSTDISNSFKDMANAVHAGDRRALAKAITLVESSRGEDRAVGEMLVRELLPYAGHSIRIGLSGAPGVGKSTFIEAFGAYLISQGHRVAVLAVDPSSRRSGGSILGDKTRMEHLSRNPNAFIRPSPSGGELGGVARRTRESVVLVEAAGFDVVIVETVGVGQSETAVADMTDMFVLLLSPGGGDELQGVKRGIMELADLVIVNKADGELLAAAGRAAADAQAALMFMRPRFAGWHPPVAPVSALHAEGIGEVAEIVARFFAHSGSDRVRRRSEQDVQWLWSELQALLIERVHEDPALMAAARAIEEDVAMGRVLAPEGARKLLSRLIPD